VTKTGPFTVAGFNPPSDVGQKSVFEIARCDRQGEYDNLHIHPYVGFDDPAGAGKTDDQGKPMVEAPIAADECVHLHWRWGKNLPGSAITPNLAKALRGYSKDNQPNFTDGAPLIPANQTLRIKISKSRLTAAEAAKDNSDDSSEALDISATGVWYCAVVANPAPSAMNLFFGHGYAVSLGWPGGGTKALTVVGGIIVGFVNPLAGAGLTVFGASGGTKVTNADLLDDPTSLLVFSYHSLRYDGGKAKIPVASDFPNLSKNRVDPTVDQGSF
jgi:hypothetical protein